VQAQRINTMKYVLEQHVGSEFLRLVVQPENAEETNEVVNKWVELTNYTVPTPAVVADEIGQ
jgi:hypothetical protein